MGMAALLGASPAWGHCDTLQGPVVEDARAAIAAGRAEPVLKWVGPADEAAVRELLARTLRARAASEDARAIADAYFFETVVRLHRAGEGEPYTGLLPAEAVEPVVVAADAALAEGDAGALVGELQAATEAHVDALLARVVAARARKDESVEAGRAYVAAYVAYVHYVEAVAAAIEGRAAHGE